MEILYLAISLLIVLILPRILSHYFFADRGDGSRKTQPNDVIKDGTSTETLEQSAAAQKAAAIEETTETDHTTAKETQKSLESSKFIQDQSATDAAESLPGDPNVVSTTISGVETPDTIMNNFKQSNNNWRCACEGGFLPPGMLQSLGGAEAAFRMSTGQCYHKKEF